MKIFLLTVSALSISVAAQAQVAFEGGEVSASVSFPTNTGAANVPLYGVAGKVSYGLGNFGIQADLGYDNVGGPTAFSIFSSYDAGLHAYYKVSDRLKTGVFYTYENVNFGPGTALIINTYGAEAMLSFEKGGVELGVGYVSGDVADTYISSSVDAYYEVSSAIELNAGIWYLYLPSGGSNFTVANFGMQYSLANLPISLGVNYNQAFNSGNAIGNSLTATISYSFGPEASGRRFSARNYGYLDYLVSSGL